MTTIGIDLGTTYSCVSFMQKKNGPDHEPQVEVVANDQGYRVTPSCVAFTNHGALIGTAAKHQMAQNSKNSVHGVKRIIGRPFSDPVVQWQRKKWDFDVFDVEGKVKIQVIENGKVRILYPEEISAMVLTRMKEIAEVYIAENVTKAVITVPAYFNNSQRSATSDAAEIAGLEVLGIINEPTAAAIAYGLKQKTDSQQNILVFDLGGGTFDATVMTISDGEFDVKATVGDTHLGGEDFTERIFDYCFKEFKKKNGVDLLTKAKNRLLKECEEVKIQLSSTNALTGNVFLEAIHDKKDLDVKVTRAAFERMNEDLFQRTLALVRQVLSDASMSKRAIHEVVLVGGSTRIPYVQNLLGEMFGKEKLSKRINPDEAVAMGAAYHASCLAGHPSAKKKAMVFTDVTPFSLGTDVDGDTMSFLIRRNEKIPTARQDTYVTMSENQSSVKIDVYEGEEEKCSENNKLGTFDLTGIPPKPAGEARIDVCFELDKSGMLKVTATETSTGVSEKINIELQSARMTDDERQRLKNQAEEARENTDQWKKRHKSLNSLESHVNEITRKLQDMSAEDGNKRFATNKRILLKTCESTKQWIEQNQEAKEREVESKRKQLDAAYKAFL